MAAAVSQILILFILPLLIGTTFVTAESNGRSVAVQPRYRRSSSAHLSPITIRQCSCDETDECFGKAYEKVAQCRLSCQKELSAFGENTVDYVTCFEDSEMEANVIGECLNENSRGFCAANETIDQELQDAADILGLSDGDNSTETNSTEISNSTTSKQCPFSSNCKETVDLVRKANVVTLHLVKFQGCVVNCLKNHVNFCLREKNCWIAIPKITNVEFVLFACSKFEDLAKSQSVKACNCIANEHNNSHIAPACPFIPFTF